MQTVTAQLVLLAADLQAKGFLAGIGKVFLIGIVILVLLGIFIGMKVAKRGR